MGFIILGRNSDSQGLRLFVAYLDWNLQMKLFTKTALVAAMATLLLSGCGGSSSPEEESHKSGLPEGLTLSFIDAYSAQYFSLNTDTNSVIDLNDLAIKSGDSAIQKLALSDSSSLGSVFFWPDFREVNGKDRFDGKYLVMKPSYELGATIDSDDFVHLVHFHGTDLAAHTADEFANPEAGSGKAIAMKRLNDFVAEQVALMDEVSEVLPSDQEICRVYVDPYLQYEAKHSHGESSEEGEHAHGDLIHFALTKTGHVFFYTEEEGVLKASQGFVKLDGVSRINSCDRTTIARSSDDGVLIFVPDSQSLYLVDSHGADYHQHSKWSVQELLQDQRMHVDMMAVLGAGAEEHSH